MPVKYQKVWDTMNELESVTTKICSAREILDCAIEAHENHNHEKVEHLLHAVDEFLVYYLQEFDDKFKKAWEATVGDLREGDVEDDGIRFWGHSDIEYLITNREKDKVKKWVLPVEESEDGLDYIVTFPDDLLEAADLKEGDQMEWIDQGDGSYLLKKVWVDPYKEDMLKAGYEMVDGVWTLKKVEKQMTHQEMLDAGYWMTGDGIWVKE